MKNIMMKKLLEIPIQMTSLLRYIESLFFIMAITFSIGAVVFFALKFESFMTGTEISIMPMLIIFLAVSSWISFSNLSYENYLEKNLFVDYDEN